MESLIENGAYCGSKAPQYGTKPQRKSKIVSEFPIRKHSSGNSHLPEKKGKKPTRILPRHHYAQMHWRFVERERRCVDFGTQLASVFLTLSDWLGL